MWTEIAIKENSKKVKKVAKVSTTMLMVTDMKVIKDKLIIERDAYHYYFERIIFKIPLISMFFHLGEW